ncbi:hypothetical protein F5Y00DRAFT_61890 [Daldinia vernicosa]|uniref:uncharacterized protein n=1 Tax=Daldinia vernicosa TaxID=114800 RepID=UPI00200796A6|nr:uncharacterized protein F5Y00DRAFT_61890 [Daldinia vernicosa]KAI0853879.1 hypothetical protein F5Y00DRAFT_61890 [Daldinia vernicosa]
MRVQLSGLSSATITTGWTNNTPSSPAKTPPEEPASPWTDRWPNRNLANYYMDANANAMPFPASPGPLYSSPNTMASLSTMDIHIIEKEDGAYFVGPGGEEIPFEFDLVAGLARWSSADPIPSRSYSRPRFPRPRYDSILLDIFSKLTTFLPGGLGLATTKMKSRSRFLATFYTLVRFNPYGQPSSGQPYRNTMSALGQIYRIGVKGNWDVNKCRGILSHLPDKEDFEEIRINGDSQNGFGKLPTGIATALVWFIDDYSSSTRPEGGKRVSATAPSVMFNNNTNTETITSKKRHATTAHNITTHSTLTKSNRATHDLK